MSNHPMSLELVIDETAQQAEISRIVSVAHDMIVDRNSGGAQIGTYDIELNAPIEGDEVIRAINRALSTKFSWLGGAKFVFVKNVGDGKITIEVEPNITSWG